MSNAKTSGNNAAVARTMFFYQIRKFRGAVRSSARTRDMFTGKKLDVCHQHFRGAIICVQSARTDQGNFEVLCVWYSHTAKRIVVEPYYIITAVYADVLTCTYVLAIKEHLHVSTCLLYTSDAADE